MRRLYRRRHVHAQISGECATDEFVRAQLWQVVFIPPPHLVRRSLGEGGCGGVEASEARSGVAGRRPVGWGVAQQAVQTTRRANQFVRRFSAVKPLSQKYSDFQNPQIRFISPPSCPTEGRLENVTDAG